jgi:hypothetical protein
MSLLVEPVEWDPVLLLRNISRQVEHMGSLHEFFENLGFPKF